MGLFANIVNVYNPLLKSSILDIWKGSEKAPGDVTAFYDINS